MQFLLILFSPIIFILIYQIYKFFKFSEFLREGMRYTWFNAPSTANPPLISIGYISGFLWSTPQKLRELTAKTLSNPKVEFPVYLNNFKYDKEYLRHSRMPKFIKKKQEKTRIAIDSRDLAKGLLIQAGAGGGKTVIMRNLMEQDISKRQLFFSMKGEFEVLYYREGIDILLNITHPKGKIHNILGESIEYIKIYINTLMSGAVGDKVDFFTQSGKNMMENWLQKIKVKESDNKLTVKEKWEEFISLIEKETTEINSGKQNSKKDVLATAEVVVSSLRLAAYRIINDASTFTVKDFTENENIKLFLSATDNESIPFMGATLAVLVKYMLQKPNIEEYDINNLTTLYLDEYLSLTRCIEDDILNSITELGRSKGLQKIVAVQKLGDDDKEIASLLTNIEYIIIGSTTHEKSLAALNKLAGEVEFFYNRVNQTISSSGKSSTISVENSSQPVIPGYLLKTIRNQDYAAITFIPKQEILYMSSIKEIPQRLRDFNTTEKIDLTDFYRYKIKLEETQKAIQKLSQKK